MKITLNIPLLNLYTYLPYTMIFFPELSLFNVINSYASFATADEDYGNVLVVTLMKITNG